MLSIKGSDDFYAELSDSEIRIRPLPFDLLHEISKNRICEITLRVPGSCLSVDVTQLLSEFDLFRHSEGGAIKVNYGRRAVDFTRCQHYWRLNSARKWFDLYKAFLRFK